MTQRTELGKLGEDTACLYLENKKYKILLRNYRETWGEIDIIARAADRTLVFVEVKTVREGDEALPSAEDQMTAAKIKKFRRIAESFARANPKLVDENAGSRLDALAITLPHGADYRTAKELLHTAKIEHYENI